MNTDAKGEGALSFGSTRQVLWNLRVDILKDGYVPKFVSWAAARGDLLEEIPGQYTAQLERGTIAGGTVINENGEAISDSRIVVAGAEPSNGMIRSPAAREGEAMNHEEVTDSQGRWLCNHVPARLQSLSFTLLHPEYRSATFRSVTVGAYPDSAGNRLMESDFRSQVAVMVMTPGRKVSGLVTGKNGKPLLGAKVTRCVLSQNSAVSQVTGIDGRFRFGDAGGEKFILTVEAAGYQFIARTIESQDQVEGLQFSLEVSDGFHAKIIDEAGQPIAGASVTVGGEGGIYWGTPADAAGIASWSSAPAKARYHFQAEGYKMSILELPADGVEHPIKLERTALSGRVLITGTAADSQSRSPIEQFEVWSSVTVRQQYNSGVWNTVGFGAELRTTGQGGKFAFLEIQDGFGPIELDDVEIRAKGYLPERRSIRWPITNGCHLDFKLTAVGLEEGIVLAPDGSPVNAAVVMLCSEASPLTGGWGGAYMDTPGQLDLKLSGASHAVTGTEGDFKIQASLSSGVLIAAHKLGFAEQKFDKLKGAVVLRLQPWGFVEGMLRIGSRPGASKTVSIHKVQEFDRPLFIQAHLSAVTDSEGRFSIEGVPPGEWHTWPHEVKFQVRPGETNRVRAGAEAGAKLSAKLLAATEASLMTSAGLASVWPQSHPPNRRRYEINSRRSMIIFMLKVSGTCAPWLFNTPKLGVLRLEPAEVTRLKSNGTAPSQSMRFFPATMFYLLPATH